MDHDLASAIFANLGTKAKLDLCQSLASCMRDIIDEPLVDEFNKVVADTGNASGELRNFIVHGQPFKFKAADGSFEVWAKFSARKGGIKGRMVRWDSAYIDTQTDAIRALIGRWEALREKSYKELSLWHSMPDDLKETGD